MGKSQSHGICSSFVSCIKSHTVPSFRTSLLCGRPSPAPLDGHKEASKSVLRDGHETSHWVGLPTSCCPECALGHRGLEFFFRFYSFNSPPSWNSHTHSGPDAVSLRSLDSCFYSIAPKHNYSKAQLLNLKALFLFTVQGKKSKVSLYVISVLSDTHQIGPNIYSVFFSWVIQ